MQQTALINHELDLRVLSIKSKIENVPEKTRWTYSDDVNVILVPSRPYAILPSTDYRKIISL